MGLDRAGPGVKGFGPGRVAQVGSPGSPGSPKKPEIKPEIKPEELSLSSLFIKSQDITHIFQNCGEPRTCVIAKLVFC